MITPKRTAEIDRAIKNMIQKGVNPETIRQLAAANTGTGKEAHT